MSWRSFGCDCGRNFISKEALDAHMAGGDPAARPCTRQLVYARIAFLEAMRTQILVREMARAATLYDTLLLGRDEGWLDLDEVSGIVTLTKCGPHGERTENTISVCEKSPAHTGKHAVVPVATRDAPEDDPIWHPSPGALAWASRMVAEKYRHWYHDAHVQPAP